MSDLDPFRVVHRARRRRTLGLSLAGAVAASALAAFAWLVPAAVADQSVIAAPAVVVAAPAIGVGAPGTQSVGSAEAATGDTPVDHPVGAPIAEDPAAQAAVLAAPAPSTVSTPVQTSPDTVPTPPPAAPREYTISIDTNGYQAELDRCLWVRMDLAGATAPIVGAHNNCGGEIVLDLLPGDIVTLSGQNVDGRYIVTASRDGRPGQDAAEATGGFPASVILQTCYFDGSDVRLVALVKVV